MELRDKRPVPDKRTEQTSGRWHMWFTLADWWKHGLFNTPHLSLLHISPSALCQSQQCTLVIFSCLEWIIVFVCFERCGRKASSVYSLCILPWFVDPNARKYEDASQGRTTLQGTLSQIHLCIHSQLFIFQPLIADIWMIQIHFKWIFFHLWNKYICVLSQWVNDCIGSDDKLWAPTMSLFIAFSILKKIQKVPWHFLH